MLAITGATGQLGRLVIDHLLTTTPADQIVAVVRDPAKAADLQARGVDVRHGDYDQPSTLAEAFKGADRVLVISSSGPPGTRVAQHQAAITAAEEAGVRHLVYTGVLGGQNANFVLAQDHQATERLLEESSLPHTILRNGWYTENYTAQIPVYVATGAIVGAASPSARVASASRQDFAEAAAAVLLADAPDTTYELSGDTAWTFAELAGEITRQTGTQVTYQQKDDAELGAILSSAGLPEAFADVLIDVDHGIERGELATTSGDLSQLIGRPTTSLQDTVAAALQTQPVDA